MSRICDGDSRKPARTQRGRAPAGHRQGFECHYEERDLTDYIHVEYDAGVATLTLNRPEKYNAWHHEMRAEVTSALSEFNTDDSVRAVIVTGAGPNAFGAGQDLTETQHFGESSAEGWMKDWSALFGALIRIEKPVVAAVNGVAVGTAFEFMLLCDIRVGHPGVRVGVPEINIGVPLTFGAWILWDVLGKAAAIELWLSGDLIDGRRAYELSVLNHLVPSNEVGPRSRTIALALAAKPPGAMRLNKRRLRDARLADFEDAMQADGSIQRQAFESREPQELMERFLSERHRGRGACSSWEGARGT